MFRTNIWVSMFRPGQIKRCIIGQAIAPTHARIRPEDILRAKAEYPEAVVIVHPECRPETQALADQILSTGGLARFVLASNVKEVMWVRKSDLFTACAKKIL